MSTTPSALQRTSRQLFRDCCRLVRHVAGTDSPKARALKLTVRTQFRLPRTTSEELESAKAAAVRALSNYMLSHAVTQDPVLKPAADRYREASRPVNENHESDATASAADGGVASTSPTPSGTIK